MTGLPLTRTARERYGLTQRDLPSSIPATRRLLAIIEASRQTSEPLRAVNAGQIQAAWLINAALSVVLDRYREWMDASALAGALAAVESAIGDSALETLVRRFAVVFESDAARAETRGAPALEQLLLVWLANENPAFAPMRELFDDAPLRELPAYGAAIESVARHFEGRPPFGPDHQALIAMLRSPALAHPQSLAGQLAYIRERWASILGDLLDRLLLAIDLLAEEQRALLRRMQGGGPITSGASVHDFASFAGEPEGFSADRDWHPKVVLIAKSAYVWLDQLSRQYGREVRRLDQVPDEELERLAAWGITGLWLIGIWQRSWASEQIKRYRGNPEAAASAYALDDYRVADELGGDAAWINLSERAGRRGLKLAADMVPNHMGIDSRWVIEHPEWFLSLAEPPYPGYTFHGPDLCRDPQVSINLEDRYWDGSDAAVVFKRYDHATGDTRYIYHGNDGTGLPWNDTAQLDFLRADVREQVIQTILHVARRFSIIRFDAAMVLTKRHVRRLWWPEPGSGSDSIPSRAERTISNAAFEAAMPTEFWREVVDRVAAEGLDTLLLAEAFWHLEGYFVRTLGMHRVYNSAFMHMLRDERNDEYHKLMRNTLEFDPEVLKRYVNFMSNPDEGTAVGQFGKGDKYFGICTLMATLPGLPMFGHGQVEGFGEKYGMEYRRAYDDEAVDQDLVARHEREIFPVLHRRPQFAEVRDFLLYDFVVDGGGVNHDVFAYSNGRGAQRSLVVYHNRFASTAGMIRDSVTYSQPGHGGRLLLRRTLAEGLGLPADDDRWFVTFRDQLTGLEYLRSAQEIRERGIWVQLDAYQRHVFLDFQDVYDGAGLWRRLGDRLGGRGVASLAAAFEELVLEPIHAPFIRLASADVARRLERIPSSPDGHVERDALLTAVEFEARAIAAAAAELSQGQVGGDREQVAADVSRALRAALAVVERERRAPSRSAPARADDALLLGTLVSLVAIRALDGGTPGGRDHARRLVDEWRLAPLLVRLFGDLGLDESDAWRAVDGVRAILGAPSWPTEPGLSVQQDARMILDTWFDDDAARRALGLNVFDDVLWFRGEGYADLVRMTTAAEMMRALETDAAPIAPERLDRVRAIATALRAAAAHADYRADALLAALGSGGRGTARRRGSRRPEAEPPARAADRKPRRGAKGEGPGPTG